MKSLFKKERRCLTLLIEALTPIRIRLPDGERSLLPGQPVDLSEEHARRLLEKAGRKVRPVLSEKDATPLVYPCCPTDWLTEWRKLAKITSGILREDPRFPFIMRALALCDEAFQDGDWSRFRTAAKQVRELLNRP
jgi:hypothetical protein